VLCERKLNSPSRAADAYEQLVRLRPHDLDAARRLRACLRDAHRFEELLIAIDREQFMLEARDPGRITLLKQAAEAWEFGIKNRYEALDAWKKVQTAAPGDAEAEAALERLRARPRTDDSLLDADLVVRPEDLRPSVGPAASDADEEAPDGPDTTQAIDDAELEEEHEHEAQEWSALFAVADSQPPTRGEVVEGAVFPVAASSETRRVIESEAPAGATGTFDAAVTLPLPPRDEARGSLAELSALIEPDAPPLRPRTQPPPPPPSRPPSTRPTPRDRDD
jgi:hypothetical protein